MTKVLDQLLLQNRDELFTDVWSSLGEEDKVREKKRCDLLVLG